MVESTVSCTQPDVSAITHNYKGHPHPAPPPPKKRKFGKFGKDPRVDTSFLPDRDREVSGCLHVVGCAHWAVAVEVMFRRRRGVRERG